MCMLLLAALAAAPVPETLETLLGRGPLVSVEADDQGRFEAAVGYAEVAAPLSVVWTVLSAFQRYKEFVPRVVESEVVQIGDGVRVSFEIESPGPNTRYTVQYALDPATHAIEGRQISGDLSGSRWRWELTEAAPGRTRLRYTSRARNFSRVLDAFEDEAQTVTAGLNVGATVTMLRALKKRCEAAAASRSAAPGPRAAPLR